MPQIQASFFLSICLFSFFSCMGDTKPKREAINHTGSGSIIRRIEIPKHIFWIRPKSEGFFPLKIRNNSIEKFGYLDSNFSVAFPIQFDRADLFSEGLAYVVEKEKRGYINKAGKWIIELPSCDNCYFGGGDFRSGITAVQISRSKYALINRKGKRVSPFFPQLGLTEDPNYTFAAEGKEEDFKWGLIDRNGNWVVAPQFKEVGAFSEGWMIVKEFDKFYYSFQNLAGKTLENIYANDFVPFKNGIAGVFESEWKLIDTSGNIVLDDELIDYSGFSEGLAPVSKIGWMGFYGIVDDGLYGYMDIHGDMVIPPQFAIAGPFINGFAYASDSASEKYGLINRKGAWVVKPVLDNAVDFDGKSLFGEFGTGYAQFDTQGRLLTWMMEAGSNSKIIDGYVVDKIGDFSDGLAAFHTVDGPDSAGNLKLGKWGFIDEEEKVVIKPQFDGDITPEFTEGMCIVSKGKLDGVISKEGKWLINPTFRSIGDFHDGIARAFGDNGIGYIDKTGNWKVPPKFKSAFDFYGAITFAKLKDVYHIIDRTGKIISENTYKYIYYLGDGIFTVQNSQTGAISANNQVILAEEYSQISSISNGILKASKEGSNSYQLYRVDGTLFSKGQWDQANDFSEGYFCVSKQTNSGLLYGFLDEKGKLAIPLQFVKAASFSEGMASVCIQKNKCGYINYQGQWAIEPKFTSTRSFDENGEAEVWQEGKPYLIDKSGAILREVI